MADEKISVITESTLAPVATDVIPVVENMTTVPVTKRKPWSAYLASVAELKAGADATKVVTPLIMKTADPVLTVVGDIKYASGAGVPDRLAKGTAYQVLRQNAALTAPEWAGGLTFIQQVVLAADGVITLSAIPGTWKEFVLYVQNLRSTDNTARLLYMKWNNDGGANYDDAGFGTDSSAGAYGNWVNAGATAFQLGTGATAIPAHNDTAGRAAHSVIHIHNPSQTAYNITFDMDDAHYIVNKLYMYKIGGGYRNLAAAITQIDLYCNSGDTKFDTGGAAYLYGIV